MLKTQITNLKFCFGPRPCSRFSDLCSPPPRFFQFHPCTLAFFSFRDLHQSIMCRNMPHETKMSNQTIHFSLSTLQRTFFHSFRTSAAMLRCDTQQHSLPKNVPAGPHLCVSILALAPPGLSSAPLLLSIDITKNVLRLSFRTSAAILRCDTQQYT